MNFSFSELGQLSADKLMEYVRNLQATSLTLGEEECNIFIFFVSFYFLDIFFSSTIHKGEVSWHFREQSTKIIEQW